MTNTRLEELKRLPKVELHAHLNGSLSQNTICKLAGSVVEQIISWLDFVEKYLYNRQTELKGCRPPDFQIKEGEAIDLANVFDVFKAVQGSESILFLAAWFTDRILILKGRTDRFSGSGRVSCVFDRVGVCGRWSQIFGTEVHSSWKVVRWSRSGRVRIKS